MEFGFVPAQVVKDLEEVGNWKARSAAVDKLYMALQKVSDKDVLLPTLSKLLRFLAILGEDANFKISLSTMQILADLAQKVGPDIRPYLGDIMPGLIDKLGDNKVVVREANADLLAGLMDVLQPGVVLDAFLPALSHGSWKIREAAVKVITQALLQHSEAVFDFPRLVNSLAQALSDHQRVITAAIEALAVVHHLIGDQIQGLLIAAGVSISSRLMLSARFASNQLPALKRDATSEAEARSQPQIALKGTHMASSSKQAAASTGNAASKPPAGPNSPSNRAMRNSSSLRVRGGEGSYPGLADLCGALECVPEELAGGLNTVGLEVGDRRGAAGSLPPGSDALGERKRLGGLAGGLALIGSEPAGERDRLEGLGVVGIVAPGMPVPSARDPIAAAPQGSSFAAGFQSAVGAPVGQPGSTPAPVKRRPRPAVEAAVAMLHDPNNLQLNGYQAGLGADQQQSGKGFQLEWPLPQPVDAAQGHLNTAAAKLSAAAARYTDAVSATRQGAANAASAASVSSAGSSFEIRSPQEGRRSTLGRHSALSTHSSAQSTDASSSQLNPFASRPRLAHDPHLSPTTSAHVLQSADADSHHSGLASQAYAAAQQSAKATAYKGRQQQQQQPDAAQQGLLAGAAASARRALFPQHLQLLEDWSITASRNLDAPEMGSPHDSEEETSSSSSSSESTTPEATPSRMQASPFGQPPHQMPRAHSAYVPTRAPVFAEANLLTAESAPQNLKIRALGLGAGLVEDDQAEASPNKAGRLQHLKMRVAEARKTVTAGAAFRPFPGSNPPAAGRRAGHPGQQPYGVGPLDTSPSPDSPLINLSAAPSTSLSPAGDDSKVEELKSPITRIEGRRKVRVTPPPQAKEGLDPFSPSALSPASSTTPVSRWDDNDMSTPSTPSVSTPTRLRPLSSAVEDRLASAVSSDDIPSAQDLQPSANPSALLQTMLQQLQQANTAKRKELDWQMQNQALNAGRRLVAHHAAVLMPQLHSFVLLALPSVDALRSTTSKTGMLLMQELFQNLRRGLDNELDAIVTALAKKSGEVSVGGRDNFLASESDKTLGMMLDSCSEIKVAPALLAHVQHKSPQVRAKIASHLDSLVQGDRGLRLAGSGAQLEKVFKAAVSFLEEGSQDARTYGKRIIWQVRQLVRADEFKGLASRVGGEVKQRKVWEVLDNAGGPPPLPLRSAYSSRSPSSRQGLSSPWGSGALDLPSAPPSPSLQSARRAAALQTPPGSSSSPSKATAFSFQAAADSSHTQSTSCLLSEYNPFSSPLGGGGVSSPFGARGAMMSPPSGLGPGPKRTAGYAASKGLASRNVSVAAARTRRRTSGSSDQTDEGRA